MKTTIHNNNPDKGTSITITITIKSIVAFFVSATSVYLVLTYALPLLIK